MDLGTSLATLSSEQVSAIKNYENELTTKFGQPVILVAYANKK
jgi:hypothetical protein